MNIRILHLSDLHIGIDGKDFPLGKNFFFHQILLEYIIKNFKDGGIDYLIISGDLSNRCMINNNMLAASMWVKALIDGLKIDPKKVIICCGNHDIETKYFQNLHDTNRLRYEKGRFYIMSEYENRSYEDYTDLLQSVSIDYKRSTQEFNDIRFFIVNSSWLSQNNREIVKAQSQALKAELATARDSALENLHEKYGAVFAEIKSDDRIISSTLNFSENTRQQLALFSRYPAFPPFKDYDDDKLTIIVFHHPEDYLHEFEKYGITGLDGSGQYGLLATNGNALICGHIHPRNRIDGENVESHIKMLIGGGAHLDNDADMSSESFKGERKPIFYLYNITNTVGDHQCEKELFFWNNTNSKIERDSIDKIPIALSRKAARREIVIKDDNHSDIKEEEIKKLKEQLRIKLLSSLLATTTAASIASLKLNYYYWMNVTERPSYRAYYKGAQLALNNNKSILIDVFFIDEHFDHHIIKTRCAKNLNSSSESNSVKYFPLFVDVLSEFITPNDKLKYKSIKQKQMSRLVNYLTAKVRDFDGDRIFTLDRLFSELGIEFPAPASDFAKFNPFSGILFFDAQNLEKYFDPLEATSALALSEILKHVKRWDV